MLDFIDNADAVAVGAGNEEVEAVGAEVECGVGVFAHGGVSVMAMMPTRWVQWKVLLTVGMYQVERVPSR